LSSGLLPSQNFLYTSINDPEHNLFNWIASTTAIVMIVLTGLAALAVSRGLANSPKQDSPQNHVSVLHILLLLSAAATLIMLRPTSLLWEFLPKLRFVQFPWRWMSTLAVPYAYFLGQAIVGRSFAVRSTGEPSRLLRSVWISVTVVVLLGFGVFFVRHTWWD